MKKPIESSIIPGFYKIPGLDHHVINKDGRIANEHTGHVLAQKVNASGYKWCSMRGDNLPTIRIHRAVALAFLDPPENYRDLVVNHKDGNKSNNLIDNLEWCTHQYNCEHAGANGLTVHCVPIQVRSFKSGTVDEFPSLMSCSRYTEQDYVSVKTKIDSGMKGARVWPDGYQYRRKTSEPWPAPILNENVHRKENSSFILRKHHDTFGRAVECDMRDLMTGKITHFDKLGDLAQFFNMSLTGIWLWLNRNDQPVVFGRYHLKLKIDPEWKTPGDLILEDASVRGYIPIQVSNPITGETRVFQTSRVCSREMGVKTGALFERLKFPKDKVHPDGWCYSRYPMFDESVPFEKMET